MKVFLSWSGDTSKFIADELRDWLGQVLQRLEPFVSSHDIAGGKYWGEAIQSELAETHYGILCITPDNIEEPWIHFEAGALAKEPDARACPLLFGGVKPTDLVGPLAQLQAKEFEKDEVFSLLKEMNEALGAEALETNQLNGIFDRFWPDLEEMVEQRLENLDSWEQPSRDLDGMVEEVLGLVREMVYGPERSRVPASSWKAVRELDTRDTLFGSVTKEEFVGWLQSFRSKKEDLVLLLNSFDEQHIGERGVSRKRLSELTALRRRLCARKAVREMRGGPSQPGCRTRLQTALSCSGQEPGW